MCGAATAFVLAELSLTGRRTQIAAHFGVAMHGG